MKLKGLTKLVLAGTALAATAATLTTSTYAWYVTNNKVEATGVSGATAGDSVAGSLLISQNSSNGTPLNYTTKINLASDVQATALDPQTKAPSKTNNNVTTYYYVTSDTAYDSDKTYYTLSGSNYIEATDITAFAANTVYYEESSTLVWVDKEGKKIDNPTKVSFSFWLKASSAMDDISVYTKFTNTATAAVAATKQQTFYAGTGLPTGKIKGDTFVVDAVNALRMEITQKAYTISTDDSYTQTTDTTIVQGKTYYTQSGAGTTESPYVYNAVAAPDVEDIATYYEKDAAATPTADAAVVTETGCVENHNACYTAAHYASPTSQETGHVGEAIFDDFTGGDANIYYKTVMQSAAFGTNGFGTTSGTGASTPLSNTAWKTIDLAKNVDNLITIDIWLEGTDAQCWDSCIGQGFKLELLFEKAGA